MRFATITPTRGDRPYLLNFCKEQLARMNTKPTKSYYVDYSPSSEIPDLVARVREGIRLAQADGFDLVFIIEDDDYYPANYFDNIVLSAFFHGAPYTYYYNLRNRTYDWWHHEHRSSLFRTGFRISALKDFVWPKDSTIFLDIDLWKFAYSKHGGTSKIQWHSDWALGIKHGIGVTGGKGHRLTMKHKDPQLKWLQSHVDENSFYFYKSLSNQLWRG